MAAWNGDTSTLKADIKAWGLALGFEHVGIAGTNLSVASARYTRWLALERHGEMHYMTRHAALRAHPDALLRDTRSIISVRMNYLSTSMAQAEASLADDKRAYIARYALGRDYHKVLRLRLRTLAEQIERHIGAFGYRVCTDSAPVLEVELAAQAGLGWRGKHTLLLDRQIGSWFFLGEIYTDLALPPDTPSTPHCGSCRRCIDVCPTGAIVAPYELDARRCISYLTIELSGSIPPELRPLIGNRVYGCDDCQLACPWNRYAQPTSERDFEPRHGLDHSSLVDLFGWTREQFEQRTAGSAIRRIGYERWLRNIAVGLGNAGHSRAIVTALRSRENDPSPLVREHVAWALERQLSSPARSDA